MEQQLTQDLQRFLLAGKSFFTLQSNKTGTRYTYRVTRAMDKKTNEPTNFWFVSLLTGPDNWENYSYIGSIRPAAVAGYEFNTTKASKLTADSLPCKAISYALTCLSSRSDIPGVQVFHAGKCGRCGRMLTVPESIASGFGPECIGLI